MPSLEDKARENIDRLLTQAGWGVHNQPLRQDNRDTYRYFGSPIYIYSLRQEIEAGFLAPYRVHRIITEWDTAGWRQSKGDLDRYRRAIPTGLRSSTQPNRTFN